MLWIVNKWIVAIKCNFEKSVPRYAKNGRKERDKEEKRILLFDPSRPINTYSVRFGSYHNRNDYFRKKKERKKWTNCKPWNASMPHFDAFCQLWLPRCIERFLSRFCVRDRGKRLWYSSMRTPKASIDVCAFVWLLVGFFLMFCNYQLPVGLLWLILCAISRFCNYCAFIWGLQFGVRFYMPGPYGCKWDFRIRLCCLNEKHLFINMYHCV